MNPLSPRIFTSVSSPPTRWIRFGGRGDDAEDNVANAFKSLGVPYRQYKKLGPEDHRGFDGKAGTPGDSALIQVKSGGPAIKQKGDKTYINGQHPDLADEIEAFAKKKKWL